MAEKVQEYYGCKVFNDHVMQERLPSAAYKSLHETIRRGAKLDAALANTVAIAMKDWALEQGATHYTHWFQPLTGNTSEKHDSFINPTKDGRVIMEFSGKALVKGEPDASSFPSGGLRATCEARGYTTWDPTSYAFVKDDVLCIPTAFCSYSGEVLDEKTPLLRSMEAISKQACRILKLFGKEVPNVTTTVGVEQEYFLVDKELFEQREDLRLCGRTLFGAMPPKGQEMDDHYFGALKPRVMAYMKELDKSLWELGVAAKTRHNEASPAQHELAPVYSTTNIAVDHNQLIMEYMKKIAARQNLACLLHEKPFEGVNGSGKHNNWSINAPGMNLLDPGDTPMENLQFLLFLASVIKAVDVYQDLLRITVCGAGNDHRLGANEAPPAIISMFVGEDLSMILDAIAEGTDYIAPKRHKMKLGVDILPDFPMDTSDRNRTSPFAFTGNKFEFRSPGSSQSVADANVVLNTAVAKSLKGYADELEKAENFDEAVIALVKRTIHDHKHVLFNGNGYSEEWKHEAAQRGLMNLPTTVDALPHLISEKNIALFEEFGVFTAAEVRARYEVHLDTYNKALHIEALTMLDMARKQITPAVNAYEADIAAAACSKKALSESISTHAEEKLLHTLSNGLDALSDETDALDALVKSAPQGDALELAKYYRDSVLPAMNELRCTADALELHCGKEYWPFPTYVDLLFGVN